MKNWIEGDNMIYNEDTKTVMVWTTYGDDKVQYFLSQEYTYESDVYEECDDRYVLVNEKIDGENTLEKLIEKSKSMIM